MALDSQAAQNILHAEMEEGDPSDTDDCQSEDEEMLVNVNDYEVNANCFGVTREKREKKSRGINNGEPIMNDDKVDDDDDDYHKMKIIQDRSYQTELLELAKKRNIIICLPTGTGKTYIALKLAEQMLPDAIQQKKKIVFLANNVPLVHQQAKYFSKNLVCTTLKDDEYVRAISGDLNLGIWKEDQWNEILTKHHILVMSTQILLDAITKAYVKWGDIALLILDECHHARKGHPMAVLMRNYGEKVHLGVPDLPKVLGLTATIIIGQSKQHQIASDIDYIEKLLCCKAVTHKNYEEVLKYSTTSMMKPWKYDTDFTVKDTCCEDINVFMELLEKLPKQFVSDDEVSIRESINHPSLTSEKQIYDKNKGVPKTLKSQLTDLLKTYAELGPFCGKLAAKIKLISIVQWIQKIDDISIYNSSEDNNIEDENGISNVCFRSKPATVLTLLHRCQTLIFQFIIKLEVVMEKMFAKHQDKDFKGYDAFIVKHCVSNKIRELIKIIQTKGPREDGNKDDELCGLIFCQRRITAQVLTRYLQSMSEHWPEELGFVKPEVMVGHSTIVKDTEVARYTAKLQTKIVRRFHEKELNCLVATQVVEEGLNVPACNLVVRFDQISTYPSFVQSMGRARKQGAICYALIDSNELPKEIKKLEEYNSYNKKLSKALEENAWHVGEEDEVPLGKYDTPIPSFCPTGPLGPVITANDAISIVHRYCNALSCDRIATLMPSSFWKPGQDKQQRPIYQAFVVLPILSPIRDVIEGDWMPHKTLAKRSAFLNVCKELYKHNELTQNLLPKPRSIEAFRCEYLDKLQEAYVREKESETSGFKIGTRKRVQQYMKKIPHTIQTSKVLPQRRVSIYSINIGIKDFTRSNEERVLYDFSLDGLNYGIVTTAKLDKIPSFLLYANYGRMKVTMKRVSTSTILTEAQLESLKSFQVFLCNSVFGLKNRVLEIDEDLELLIAPLYMNENRQLDCDWDMISILLDFDESTLMEEPSEIKRKEMTFEPSSYTYSVLVPWYKEDSEPELLCMLNFCEGSSALSEFDDPKKFATYAEYYKKKYGLNLYHPEFPLIKAKPLGKQLNFLTKKGDPKVMRREFQRSGLKMVQELVNIHEIPASLLVQGRFLPSILHRIYRLCIAEELKNSFESYFGVMTNDVDEEFESDADNLEDMDSSENENSLEAAWNSMTISSTSKTHAKKAKMDEEKEREIVLLETINPLEIPCNMLQSAPLMSLTCLRKSGRDSKFVMPEPPVRKSNIDELVNISDIIFPSFDKTADFYSRISPPTEMIMEALTLSNAQDCISLEKLEVMGDSVLKLLVSLHIFSSFPTWDEGKMTLLRTQLISNRYLYQLGKTKEIGELLSGSFFIPEKNWMPPSFTVAAEIQEFVSSRHLDYEIFRSLSPSIISEPEDEIDKILDPLKLPSNQAANRKTPGPQTTFTHSKISDKSVADAMEAIIGAFYIKGGLDGAFRILEWLGLRGPLQDGSAPRFSRESTLTPPVESPDLKRRPKQNIIPMLEDLEQILSYKFKNPWLAVEALTHPSYMANRVTSCYERLEYCGDAILDFLVTHYILHNTKITDPGKITDLRAALVNNVTFASLSVRYGFHTFLKYDSELLGNHIELFREYQEENNHEVTNPHKLFSDYDCPTVAEIEVPKVLGDIFESLAGAVFVDSGMSLDAVWKVFYRLMKKEIELFSKSIPKSPLRELYEYFPAGKAKFIKLSSENRANPKSKHHTSSCKYQTVCLQVPKFKPILGIGGNIRQAKQAAAKYVIRKLREEKCII